MTTNRSSRSAWQRFACALGVSAMALSFSGIISGCGPEAQTPVKVENTNAVPGGGSTDDYAKKMQEIQSGQGAKK